jgi:hypothetical protein
MKKKESADASTGATSSRRTCMKRWRMAVISGLSRSEGVGQGALMAAGGR